MTFSKIRTNTVGKIRTDGKNSVLFFRHGYQIKGFCKYNWNKAYISQSDYIELFYKH